MSTDSIISIDGSHGEGGGQVLRNAISFATILNKNISISKIRAGRSKPGLRAQHMTGMKLCTELVSGAVLTGCELQSTEISFTTTATTTTETVDDNKIEFVGDPKTAGSICLILQAALPVALFARTIPTDLILKGGTNASFAPQYDYWEQVFLPILISHCGFPDDFVQHKVVRRGYFPQGGGEVRLEIEPWTDQPLPPISLTERGDVSEIWIRSYHAGTIPPRVALDMVNAAKQVLKDAGIHIVPEVEIIHETQAIGSGCGILLVATTTTGCRLAGSALGERRKLSTIVGTEAAEELLTTLNDGGCVDEWLQDQLILFMALASGTSELLTGSLTLHTKTAIWLAEEVAGAKFDVTRVGPTTVKDSDEGYGKDGRIPGKHLIRCVGVNHINMK